MSSFPSTGPVDAAIHVELGNAQITATGQNETSVEVHPFTSGNADDIRVAGETEVEYADGRLTVRTPKAKGLSSPRGSISLKVSLPRGSRLDAHVSVGDFSCTGVLGDCEVRTGAGDIRVAQGDAVRLKAQHGHIDLDRALGRAEVSTGSGHLRIGAVDGDAELRNANGDIKVGLVAGDVEVRASNGCITIGRAGASVMATTASGHVKVEEVVRGTVELHTSLGNLEIGVRPGTSALLDLHSRLGDVHNALAGTGVPTGGASDVRITGWTQIGDVVVQHSPSGA